MALSPAQLEKYADVLMWGLETARPEGFSPYDAVLLRAGIAAMPLAEALHRKLVRRKFHVTVKILPTPALEKDFYLFSDKKQRGFINHGEKEYYENLNGNIYLNAPASLTHLRDIEPGKIGETTVVRKTLNDIALRRGAAGKYSWTLCTYPTEELAKNARLTLGEYTAQIVKACFLNEAAPVKKWRQIHKNSVEIKKWLKSLGIDTLRAETKSMDLEIKLGEKRRFLGISGRNIPSFEIFTSPDWRGTRGTFYADMPSFRNGNYVRGMKLGFKNGRAVKISAEEGENFVRRTLAMDEGACRVGEFSLTDKRFSKIDRFMADTLFDENYGGKSGNCHIAAGFSYSDSFDGNPAALTKKLKKKLGFNDSSLHWDLVNTQDKTVTARLRNGRTMLIYEKGMFRY